MLRTQTRLQPKTRSHSQVRQFIDDNVIIMSKGGKIDDVGVDEDDDGEESMLITLIVCMQQNACSDDGAAAAGGHATENDKHADDGYFLNC